MFKIVFFKDQDSKTSIYEMKDFKDKVDNESNKKFLHVEKIPKFNTFNYTFSNTTQILNQTNEQNSNLRYNLSRSFTNLYRAASCKSLKSIKSNRIIIEKEGKIDSTSIPFLILIKDTRMACMLFVVSIVFVATYLPSILATRAILLNDNLYIVYLYFINSATNPIINFFINRSFRYDLLRLLKKSRPSFSAFSTPKFFQNNLLKEKQTFL